MSSRLSSESRVYADKARDLNRQVSHFHFSFMIIVYHVNLVLTSEISCCNCKLLCSRNCFYNLDRRSLQY